MHCMVGIWVVVFGISGLFSIQDIIYKQSIEPLRRFTGFIFFLHFPRLHPFSCRNYFTHFIPIE